MRKIVETLLIVFFFVASPILVFASDLPEIPGLQVWLKSDNAIEDDNSRVQSWPDSSGKENYFSQQNQLRQPIVIEDSINGFPAVQFLGNDFLDSSSISALNTPRITSFIVFKMVVPPGKQDVIFSSYKSGAGKNSDQFWGVFGEYPNFGVLARKSDGSAKTVTRKIGKNWAVFSMVWNSSTELNAWLDGFSGNAITGANAVPAGHIKTRIGASTDNPKHCSKIGISEILIYNRALTVQERTSVEEYLQDKYFSDNSSPQVTAVSAIGNSRKIIITFNEDINEAEAEIISNYSLDAGINITGAVLSENGNRVELALDKPLSANTGYTMRMNNIRDLSGNVVPENTEAAFDYVDIPSDDMVLWLRGDGYVLADDDSKVLAWEDGSGNSNNAVALKGNSPRPVLVDSALNGKPAISFSGKKSLLRCNSIPALETDKISWFAVLKTNSPDEAQGVLVGSYSEGAKGNSDEMWGSIIRDNDLLAFARSQKGHMVSVRHPLDNGWHIQSAVWKESNSVEAYMDGNLKMMSSGATAVPDKHNFLFIGAENSRGQHSFSGDIAEIIVYSNELSDAERMKIEAYLEAKYFNAASALAITASAGANGSISPTGAVSVNNGEDQVFTITADANYHVSDVLVDGVSVGTVEVYQFTNVTTDHTISASFAIDTHNVTFDLAGKGERAGGGELAQAVNHGSGATAPAVTANAGWTFTGWDKAFDNITADTAVTAQYSKITCTITVSSGDNGSITPNGAVPVEFGASQVFTIASNASYHVSDVLVDGVSIGAVATCEFTNVTANHTISASFALNTYTLAYTSGANGSITGTMLQTVNHGADGSPVTAVPNEGYHFTGWSDFSTANPRTDTGVTANVAVTANFAINTYTVTFDCGYNGALQGEKSQTVNYDGTCSTVTAVPIAGYRIVKWTIEPSANASALDVNSPAINVGNVKGDCTVTATFCLAAQDILVNSGNLYTKSRTISIDPLVFTGTQYASISISESPAMDNPQIVQNTGVPFTWQMTGTQEKSYMLYFRYMNGSGVPQGEIMPRQVILDTTPPSLDIITPTDGGTTDQGFIRLELTAFDPSPVDPADMDSGREVKVFVNGEQKENIFENRLVIDRFPVSGAGANSVTVTVEDEAGNVTERTVTWTVDPSSDTVAPTISSINITEDTDSGVGTGVTTVPDVSEIWIQGMLDDPKANVRYSVNGSEFEDFNIRRNNAGNYQFCGLVPLDSGTNSISIEAYDLAGNVSTYSHVLNRSTHKIEITSHTPESFANGAAQNISGKISSTIGDDPVMAVTVNGVSVASGDLVDNGDGTLTFTANAVPPAADGAMTSINVGADTAAGKKIVANAMRIEGYEILYRDVRRSWSQKWHIVNSRTSLNMLFGDIDLYDPEFSNSKTQRIRYFAPNEAMYGTTVGDPDISNYPPLGAFWTETGMDEFPISSADNSAIAAELAANKGNSSLFQAGMWKQYTQFSGGPARNPLPSIDVLYQKYATVMEVMKPVGGGKQGEKVKVLLSFSGMTYERFADSPPLDLNLVTYNGKKPFSVDPATGTATYLVEVQRGVGFTVSGSDFKWPDFAKTTVTRTQSGTTSKTEDRGRFSFESVHNEDIDPKIISIQFVSNHHDSNGKSLLKKSWKDTETEWNQSYTYVGNPFEQPEWLPNYSDNTKTRNNPITQTMGTPLQIKMYIKEPPAGKAYKIVSDETDNAFKFESTEVLSTGKEMPMNSVGRTDGVMQASDNLPNKVQRIKKTIKWKLLLKNPQSGKFLEFPIGTSGGNEAFPDGHWIFTTIDTPNETCSRNKAGEYSFPWTPTDKMPITPLPNALTFMRIDYITRPCGNIENKTLSNFIDDCAKAVYNNIRSEGSGILTGIDNTSLASCNIWGLLDRNLFLTGQCVPQAFLHEMALRLIGISAEFRFITAADNLPVFETDGNQGGGKFHDRNYNGVNEWLFLIFSGSGSDAGLNMGEGTCLCNGKYYPGNVAPQKNFISDSTVDLLNKLKNDNDKQEWFYYNNGTLIGSGDYQNFPTGQ